VYLGSDWVQLRCFCGSGSHGPRTWLINLEHLINGLRTKPRSLFHCGYQRHLFPDHRWGDSWQHLRADGDRDAAARLFTKRSGTGRSGPERGGGPWSRRCTNLADGLR